jgi:Sec-independent protein secretion pathway component TatC
MSLEQRRRVTYRSLQDHRKYVYVVIFFLAACLTESPDYPGQLLLAIPSLILFEILILLMEKCKIVVFSNFQDQ